MCDNPKFMITHLEDNQMTGRDVGLTLVGTLVRVLKEPSVQGVNLYIDIIPYLELDEELTFMINKVYKTSMRVKRTR